MATPGLPEQVDGLTAEDHRNHHETIHAHENTFNYGELEAAPDGQVIKKVNGVWTAGVDVQGGGGGAEIGLRYVDPQQPNNTADGLTPATAKRDIQAAVDSLPGGGGKVILASHANHFAGSQIEDNGKPVLFQGMGKDSTDVICTAQYGAVFHLTGNGSGVRDFAITTNNKSRIRSGALFLHEKHCFAQHMKIGGFGADVNVGIQADDPDAPYGIKSMSPDTDEASYPDTGGGTNLADWLYINDIDFFPDVYRGIVMLGGCNGQIFNLRRRGMDKGALYFERGGAFLNTSFEVGLSHVVSDPSDHPSGTRDQGYLVYMRSIASQKFMWMRFLGMRTESFWSDGPAHYYCDVESVSWTGCSMHGAGGQQRKIDFGPNGNSDRNVVNLGLQNPNLEGDYQNASNVLFSQYQQGPAGAL